MKWTCLLVIALIAGCATLPPQLKEAKARTKANRAKLPMPQQAAKVQVAAKAIQPPSQEFGGSNGVRVERWVPAWRWKVSAFASNKLQAAKFEAVDGNGKPILDVSWFGLPYFGFWTNAQGVAFVTSNVPNVPHLFFRNAPTAGAKARATTNAPVPKWFLDADKNIR